jgi:hypothetical protein
MKLLLYLRRALASLRAGVRGPLPLLVQDRVVLIQNIEGLAERNPKVLFTPERDGAGIVVSGVVNERAANMRDSRLCSQGCGWSRKANGQFQVETDSSEAVSVSFGMRSLYEILGVSPSAPPEVIRAAYRALAKTHHPDGSKADKEKFLELKRAHDILMDPDQRANYDAQFPGANGNGRAQYQQAQAPPRPAQQIWVNGIGWVDARDVQFPGGAGSAYPQPFPPNQYPQYPGIQNVEEMFREAVTGTASSFAEGVLVNILHELRRRR